MVFSYPNEGNTIYTIWIASYLLLVEGFPALHSTVTLSNRSSEIWVQLQIDMSLRGIVSPSLKCRNPIATDMMRSPIPTITPIWWACCWCVLLRQTAYFDIISFALTGSRLKAHFWFWEVLTTFPLFTPRLRCHSITFGIWKSPNSCYSSGMRHYSTLSGTSILGSRRTSLILGSNRFSNACFWEGHALCLGWVPISREGRQCGSGPQLHFDIQPGTMPC